MSLVGHQGVITSEYPPETISMQTLSTAVGDSSPNPRGLPLLTWPTLLTWPHPLFWPRHLTWPNALHHHSLSPSLAA
jgi:hypothetical protein